MALGHIECVRDLRAPATVKILLYALASRADQHGYCWPSIGRLCIDTGLARRTVQTQLGRLVARGAVEREVRSGRASLLHLKLDALRNHPWLDGDAKPPASGGEPATKGRTSCAPPAQPMRPPAHLVRPTRARGAPEVKGEVTRKSQGRSAAAGATVDKPLPRSRDSPEPWWRSSAGVMLMGLELGLPARPGEDYPQYKDRVFREWRARAKAASQERRQRL